MEKLTKVLSSELWIILPKICPTNSGEHNPDLYTRAIDTDLWYSQVLSDIMSNINVSIFWIPNTNYYAREKSNNNLIIEKFSIAYKKFRDKIINLVDKLHHNNSVLLWFFSAYMHVD